MPSVLLQEVSFDVVWCTATSTQRMDLFRHISEFKFITFIKTIFGLCAAVVPISYNLGPHLRPQEVATLPTNLFSSGPASYGLILKHVSPMMILLKRAASEVLSNLRACFLIRNRKCLSVGSIRTKLPLSEPANKSLKHISPTLVSVMTGASMILSNSRACYLIENEKRLNMGIIPISQ